MWSVTQRSCSAGTGRSLPVGSNPPHLTQPSSRAHRGPLHVRLRLRCTHRPGVVNSDGMITPLVLPDRGGPSRRTARSAARSRQEPCRQPRDKRRRPDGTPRPAPSTADRPRPHGRRVSFPASGRPPQRQTSYSEHGPAGKEDQREDVLVGQPDARTPRGCPAPQFAPAGRLGRPAAPTGHRRRGVAHRQAPRPPDS